MPLIVLYDPKGENDRLDRINGYPMSHENRNVHYWAMREGNPFQGMDVLWINRRFENIYGDEVFSKITEVVYNNIDHMYIWSEDEIFMNIQGWLVDTDDGFELSDQQLERLGQFTCDDVFLAVEMTEHAAWGSNAFQRFSRIVQCVSNNIPVIYAVPESSYRGDGWGRGTHSPGQLHWWGLEDGAIVQAVEDLISENQDISRNNIQDRIGFDLPPTFGEHAGDYGNVDYQPFSQWVHPFMLALWDTYNVPVYAHEIASSYSYVPDGYGASGNQLTSLYTTIQLCISHAMELIEDEDYLNAFAETKAAIQATVVANADIFLNSRNEDYDAICIANGFPQTTFCRTDQERASRNQIQHFSLRGDGMNSSRRANSIYSVEGNTHAERSVSVIENLNVLSKEYNGNCFEINETFDFDILGLLFGRQSMLVTRCSPAKTYDQLTHANKVFQMIYLDYQYCRVDADSANRPNGGINSIYSGRHTFGAYLQGVSSNEYFSAEYWNPALMANSNRQRRMWAERSDILLLSDGIFLGSLWWPEGVNTLAGVPRLAGED